MVLHGEKRRHDPHSSDCCQFPQEDSDFYVILELEAYVRI
jgi:hypothetical protein